jgi:hypothetical protein
MSAATYDLEQSCFSMEHRKPHFPVTIMMPYVDGIRGPVVASMLYYAKHFDVGFELVGNTIIASARNELANRFLRSKAEWSFWLDSDVFIPFGDTPTFITYSRTTKGQNFAQHNTLLRLLEHDLPLVGGAYPGRFKGSPLTIQPDLAPRDSNDQRISQSLREGLSAGGVQPVAWLAAGLMLVHRLVFERIMKRFPWTPPMPDAYYPFFVQEGPKGEDVYFCEHAQAAGIQPYLDTEVRAGHIGLGVWTCEDSQSPLPIRNRNGTPRALLS